MKEGDIVYIKPEVVDPYFQLKKPRGRIVGWRSLGMIAKVEIFDTASQDSEGHNCVEKFSFHDLSTEPFPSSEPAPSPPPEAAVPGRVDEGNWRRGYDQAISDMAAIVERKDREISALHQKIETARTELLKQVRQARANGIELVADELAAWLERGGNKYSEEPVVQFIGKMRAKAQQAREEGK